MSAGGIAAVLRIWLTVGGRIYCLQWKSYHPAARRASEGVFPHLFPYPDDYRGEDRGTEKVWLRADLMSLLPDDLCAASAQEALSFFDEIGWNLADARCIRVAGN